MNIADKVFVVDWGKRYSDITKWDNETKQRENIFPIKTKLPDYCGIEHHWKYKYEPNLTLKGTVNKREPKKLVEKIPIYKNYKWEVLEIFKHPKAGKLYYDLDQYTQEQLDNWKDYSKYTENNLLLLASTHTDKDWMKCYIIIEETGVSNLTPEQYANNEFDALKQANYGKRTIDTINKKDFPKELLKYLYDSDQRTQFGASMTKAIIKYPYVSKEYTVNGNDICLGWEQDFNGVGCDLTDNETISWNELPKRFPENKFTN